MEIFKSFVIKEFRHILRDRRTLLILFGLPIAMLMIFGYAIRNEVNNAEIAVLDHSNDVATRTIIQKLDASEALSVALHLSSPKKINEVMQSSRVKEVVVFEKHFQRKLQRQGVADVQIITDATEPNIAGLVQQYSMAVIQSWQPEDSAFSGASMGGIQPHIEMLFNSQLKSVYFFVPGLIAVILMIVSTMMTSVSIAKEKETGTMEVLLVSPLRSYHIIVGKVLPYFVLSFVNILTVLALARWVFGLPFRGSLIFFLAVSMLFIFSALALGVYISTQTDDQQNAMMASLMGTMLPTMILSGFVFPLDSIPQVLQWVSNIVPAKWFLIMVRGVMLMGIGITHLWISVLILFAMTIGLIAAGILNFSNKLE